MYKCCWNCDNGFTVCASTMEQTVQLNSSMRLCCAPYPISNHVENAFKRRRCTQFQPSSFMRKGYLIDKEEAEVLQQMTIDELVEYWKSN